MWTDACVILIYFVSIFGIGLYMGRKQSSLESYALGDRTLPWWAILASILAAEISAATFLGAPGEGYAKLNFTYAQLCIGTIIARIIVGKLFLKPYYQYNVVSIYEYLEKRFGQHTRRYASMVFLISRVLASGARLYFAGILLVIAYQYLTGTVLVDPSEKVLIYAGALILVTVATTIYTALGGLKAVVWTDVLQACILAVALISTILILYFSIEGGWDTISAALDGPKDWSFFDFGFVSGGLGDNITALLGNEYTIWTAFLGATFITMATHGTDQDMVQRMLAAKNSKSGSRAVILSGLIDFPIVITFLFTGILLYVFYKTNPQFPVPSEQIEIFPSFIIYNMPAGIRGLLIAALLATAMGSLSTALNALATTATKDWYQDIFKKDASERQLLCTVRWMTVAFAVLLIIVGIVTAIYVVYHPDARIIPIALGIFGYTYGSLLGVFLLGMLTKKRGSDIGNGIAMLAGCLAILFLCKIIPLPETINLSLFDSWQIKFNLHIPDIAFPWRVTIGTLITFCIGACFRTKSTAYTQSHPLLP